MTATYRTRLQAVVDSLGDDPATDAVAATLRGLLYDQLPPARIVPAIDDAIGTAPTRRARTLLHTARTAVIGNPVPAPTAVEPVEPIRSPMTPSPTPQEHP